jgi:integrase
LSSRIICRNAVAQFNSGFERASDTSACLRSMRQQVRFLPGAPPAQRMLVHFLSWAKKEGEQVDAKVHLPKLPKRLVEVLSREEIQRMEHAARTERDKLIIRLLADTGLRVGELLGLRTNDLVEQNRNYYLHVRGKGAKDLWCPHPKYSGACASTSSAADRRMR